eukprot:SAG22_NODE_4474_length_1258_cov_1.145815_1_plen_140_part_10
MWREVDGPKPAPLWRLFGTMADGESDPGFESEEDPSGNSSSSGLDTKGPQFEQIKKDALAAATAEEEGAGKSRSRILVAVCVLEIMANFDAGVLPATIGHVMSEFELNYADGGSLGALVYMGLVLGAPVAGWALTNFTSQ